MILHIIARLNVGGTSVWIKNLINGFEAKGISSRVLTGRVVGEIEDQLYQDPRTNLVKGLGQKSSFGPSLYAFFEIRRYVIRNRPKIVNTHTTKAGILGRLAVMSVFGDRPQLVHTIHGHYLYGYSRPIISKLWLLNEAFLCFFTDKVICVGSNVREDLISTHLFSKKKLVTILPGIEKPKVSSEHSEVSSLRFEQDKFIVGWMGRMESVKSPNLYVEIAKKLPNVIFIMVGSGSLEQEILNNAPENLFVHHFLLPEQLWSIAHLAVSTSRNEGVPTSLIEANACGIPIVAPNVGSIGDVVSNGVNGYLVSKLEIELFCQIISRLSDSKEEMAQLKKGCHSVSPKFEISSMIDYHLSAFQLN